MLGGGESHTTSVNFQEEMIKRGNTDATLLFPFLATGSTTKISSFIKECVGKIEGLPSDEKLNVKIHSEVKNESKQINSLKRELNDINVLLLTLTSTTTINKTLVRTIDISESPARKRLCSNINDINNYTHDTQAKQVDMINEQDIISHDTVHIDDTQNNSVVFNNINDVLMKKSNTHFGTHSYIVTTATTNISDVIFGLLKHKLKWVVSDVDSISKQDRNDIKKSMLYIIKTFITAQDREVIESQNWSLPLDDQRHMTLVESRNQTNMRLLETVMKSLSDKSKKKKVLPAEVIHFYMYE
jgi:hypothetical protein